MNDNSISCGVVRDLLPLYIDGVCSDESKILVSEHLDECEACSKEYKSLMSDTINITPDNKEVGESIKKIGKKLKKDRKKSALKAVAITLATLMVISVLILPDIMVKYAMNRYVYRHQQLDMHVYNHKDGKIKVGNIKLNLPEKYTALENGLVIERNDNYIFRVSLSDPNRLETSTNQIINILDMNLISDNAQIKLDFSSENSGGQGGFSRWMDKIGARKLGYGEDDYYEFMNFLYTDEIPQYSFFSSFKNKAAVFACYDCLYYMVPDADGRFTFETDSYKCYGYAKANGFDEDLSYSPCTYFFYLYDKNICIEMLGYTKAEAEYIMSSLVFE